MSRGNYMVFKTEEIVKMIKDGHVKEPAFNPELVFEIKDTTSVMPETFIIQWLREKIYGAMESGKPNRTLKRGLTRKQVFNA